MANQTSPGAVVRRSISRPDSSGGRRDIPATNSMQSLTAPSPEPSGTAGDSRPGTAGTARCKTPAGAAPPRRSISANRSYHVQQQQQHATLPDDDSLVLYKDPSGITAQESMNSVVSGRHQDGETFFTALRRNYSYGSESELGSEAGLQEVGGSLACMDSQANPMRSPTSSAYFTAAEGSDYGSIGASLQEEYSTADSMAACESSATTMYPEASAAGDGMVPTESVMDVINNLYCSHAAEASSSQQQTNWYGLEQSELPLLAQPVCPVLPAAAKASELETQAPGDSSGISAEQDAGGTNQQPELEQSAASDVESCSTAMGVGRHDCGSTDNTASSTGLQQQPTEERMLAEASVPISYTAAPHHTLHTEDGCAAYPSPTDAQLSDEIAAVDEPKPQHAEEAPDDTGAIRGENEPLNTVTQQQEQEGNAAAYLNKVEGLLASRVHLQAELGEYVAGLASKLGEDGQQLVEIPANYQLMVERLLCERKAQYQALDGWEGPHRFDDLPIAQLPITHDDPRIAAGLEVIHQLDEKLKDAWLQAQVAARGSNPEQWAEAEKQRLEAKAAQLEAGLAKERQKRLHAARLLRALKKIDEQQAEALVLPGSKGVNSYSYYKLQLQEERLLAAVLSRDEGALEHDNPFDATTLCIPDDDPLEQQASLQSNFPVSQHILKQHSTPSTSTSEAAIAAESIAADDTGLPHLKAPSGRPSTQDSFWSMHSTLSISKRRHSLAEIDAMLEALQAGYTVGHGSSLGSTRPSFAAVTDTSGSSTAGSRRVSSQPSAPQVVALGSCKSSVAGIGAKHSQQTGPDQRQQPSDYVREQREAKEMLQRERDIDAKLRALRTSELPTKLEPEQLQTLLQQCVQLSEAVQLAANV